MIPQPYMVTCKFCGKQFEYIPENIPVNMGNEPSKFKTEMRWLALECPYPCGETGKYEVLVYV